MRLTNGLCRVGFLPSMVGKIAGLLTFLQVLGGEASAASSSYTAVTYGSSTVPDIVVQYNSTSGTGFSYDWTKGLEDRDNLARDPEKQAVVLAARYLQEGIFKMTGKKPNIVSGNTLTNGIVLTLIQNAPSDIQTDPDVIYNLRKLTTDEYNANEAVFVRTGSARTIIVANTGYGFPSGAAKLLEYVDYQVLGMGPNWTHVPDFQTRSLVFNLEWARRPLFYIRNLVPASGQLDSRNGTLDRHVALAAPDEAVETSFDRWRVGTYSLGTSMPPFPGHALDSYHTAVLQKMVADNTWYGFVNDIVLGYETDRTTLVFGGSVGPVGQMWVNKDPSPSEHQGKVYISNGNSWVLQPYDSTRKITTYTSATMDLSMPFVRDIILNEMINRGNLFFRDYPDKYFVFGTEPEDGGVDDKKFNSYTLYKSWYPNYRTGEGQTWGSYKVHNYLGLSQPTEMWTSPNDSATLAGAAQTDSVFGLNNWLLRKYDQHIDQLPDVNDVYSGTTALVIGRKTRTGQPKKTLIRTSLYSYNYHDVPPEYNLDQRIRVMIAGYPKHRGTGKWINFKTENQIAGAFKKLLPLEPTSVYWILSMARELDDAVSKIKGGRSLEYVHGRISGAYANGIKGMSAEMDFNFGTYGLMYYLYTVMLYNPNLSVEQLKNYRTTWLVRAFGTAAKDKMEEYYKLMEPENFVNAPNFWARAIALLDEADALIASGTPQQKRLDDLKQFWYFYYLLDIGATSSTSAFKEFFWKGQMSYMTAMHMVSRRFFGGQKAFDGSGSPYNSGPAHYSASESSAWWQLVKDHWPVVPVDYFPDLTLSDGITKGRDVDLRDLVQVDEFQSSVRNGCVLDATDNQQVSFYTVTSGGDIGFKLYWPYTPGNGNYEEKDVPYGISYFNSQNQDWENIVDITMTSQRSIESDWSGTANIQLVEVRYSAARAGTYRIDVGPGSGESAKLRTLDYNPMTNQDLGTRSHTYASMLKSDNSDDAYFYIPKGIVSLDIEIWDSTVEKKLTFHTGLPKTGLTATRTETIPVGFKGTKRYTLAPGERGSIVKLVSGRSAFPPYVYSVPTLWAQSHSALLVPRKIAEIDGLTPIAP